MLLGQNNTRRDLGKFDDAFTDGEGDGDGDDDDDDDDVNDARQNRLKRLFFVL